MVKHPPADICANLLHSSSSGGGKGAEQQQEGQQGGQEGGGGKTVEWAIFKHPAVLSLMTFQWASDNTEFTLRSLGPIFFMESFGISVRKTQRITPFDALAILDFDC